MIKTEDRDINGRTYRITQHGAKEGRRILARIVQHLGEPLKATGSAEGAGAFGAALGEFVKGLSPAEVDYFCDAFAPKTQVAWAESPDGWVPLGPIFDSHFAGNYGEMLAWLAAAIEVNYASFFAEVRLRAQAVWAKAAAMMVTGSRSRKVATGESTESPQAADTAPG